MPQSPRCGRWTACLGGGCLQRIGIHFWKGNTTQLSLIDLGRTLRSCLQHFVRFSTSFPQMGTEIDAHMLLNFLLHREMWRTLQVDVHWEASTEWMWGDTGFRLLKYTCIELPLVLPCYHFAAYYSFPEKKSVPELNDQFLYTIIFTLFSFILF